MAFVWCGTTQISIAIRLEERVKRGKSPSILVLSFASFSLLTLIQVEKETKKKTKKNKGLKKKVWCFNS